MCLSFRSLAVVVNTWAKAFVANCLHSHFVRLPFTIYANVSYGSVRWFNNIVWCHYGRCSRGRILLLTFGRVFRIFAHDCGWLASSCLDMLQSVVAPPFHQRAPVIPRRSRGLDNNSMTTQRYTRNFITFQSQCGAYQKFVCQHCHGRSPKVSRRDSLPGSFTEFCQFLRHHIAPYFS